MSENFNNLAGREQGLKRDLTSGQLTMIAIGGAIGTGLFLGSGLAIGLAGPSVVLSYGIGAFIALLLMGCLAEMTVAHPTPGSFGTWAEFYVHPMAGFLVRYSYWSAIVLAVGTEVTAIAVYMARWFPGVPGWIWIVGFSGILIAVNLLGVGVFGAVEYAFAALKVGAIIIFIVTGARLLFDIGPVHYTAHGGVFPHGVWGMWVAVIVSIFSYLSIEMIAVAAGEAADPKTAITKAFRSCVARLAVFYLLTLALIVGMAPWTTAGKGESPFVTVMARTHIPFAADIVNLVILAAALSAMNSQLYISTRMMFSLARAGQAPKSLGVLNRRGTPASALAVSTAGIAVAVLVNALAPDTSFTVMMAIAMFGAIFTWTMIFVTHLFFRRRHKGEHLAFRMWGYPYATLAGAFLMTAIVLTTAFTTEFRMTLAYGIPFLLVLVAVWRVRFQR